MRKKMAAAEFLALACPHCEGTIILFPGDRNCGIFRHGVFRNSENHPIPAHASQAEIEHWLALQAIHGCGRPFQLRDGENTPQKCDYI
jgi:hypothetical protein